MSSSRGADWQAVVAEQGAGIGRKVICCQRRGHGVCRHDIGAVVSARGLRHAGPLRPDKAGQAVVSRRQRRRSAAVIGFGGIADDGGRQRGWGDVSGPGGADWQAVVAEQGAGIGRKVTCCQHRGHRVGSQHVGAVVRACGLCHAGPLGSDKAGQGIVGRCQRRRSEAVIGLGWIADNSGGQRGRVDLYIWPEPGSKV